MLEAAYFIASHAKETLWLARTRIHTQTEFSTQLLHAARKFIELIKSKGKLQDKKKTALAVRAAHDCRLGYGDGEVDPLIVTAIFAFADSSCSELDRANALVEAWDAYDNKWFNKTLH